MTGCNALFMPGSFLCGNERRAEARKVFEELKDLNLSSIRYLDDRSLKTLIECSPTLESLTLSSCNILFRFGKKTCNLKLFHLINLCAVPYRLI